MAISSLNLNLLYSCLLAFVLKFYYLRGTKYYSMGTLGCINDMMRRDKENRELRNRNHERMNDTRNRLIEVGKGRELPDMSADSIDHIRKNTVEKERADNDKLFRLKLKFAVIVGVALLLCYVAYVFIIK